VLRKLRTGLRRRRTSVWCRQSDVIFKWLVIFPCKVKHLSTLWTCFLLFLCSFLRSVYAFPNSICCHFGKQLTKNQINCDSNSALLRPCHQLWRAQFCIYVAANRWTLHWPSLNFCFIWSEVIYRRCSKMWIC